MKDTSSNPKVPKGSAAACRTHAADNRFQAAHMDTRTGRRELEESAASWDERGELLGRLEASFDKRQRLDEASSRFTSERAESVAQDARLGSWENEGGGVVAPLEGQARPGDRPISSGSFSGPVTPMLSDRKDPGIPGETIK